MCLCNLNTFFHGISLLDISQNVALQYQNKKNKYNNMFWSFSMIMSYNLKYCT